MQFDSREWQGFPRGMLRVAYDTPVQLDIPFLDVLIRDFGYPCLGLLQDHLVQHIRNVVVKKITPLPAEYIHPLFFVLARPGEREVYVPKWLGHERLDLFVSCDDESKGGELTRTI